jgi:hypothetical protein
MEWLLAWTLLSIGVGIAAKSRGRLGFAWFVIAMLITPVLALIFLVVMRQLAPDGQAAAFLQRESAVTAETHTRCPDCRELVRRDARKCRHCGAALAPQQL